MWGWTDGRKKRNEEHVPGIWLLTKFAFKGSPMDLPIGKARISLKLLKRILMTCLRQSTMCTKLLAPMRQTFASLTVKLAGQQVSVHVE